MKSFGVAADVVIPSASVVNMLGRHSYTQAIHWLTLTLHPIGMARSLTVC